MKNIVFISPNFPTNYWRFCAELKNNGLNVLGVGDQPYDQLNPNLKNSLTEYYKVSSLENYDEVYKAVAFFAFKYGRIDWLESNNEYWLEKDAKLRTDFNITSGFKSEDMEKVKYKSKMKQHYIKAGIPVARYYLVEDLKGCRDFINEVGYPVIVKPDNGVGANATYKLKTDEDLVNFINTKPDVTYIMEEFIDGQVETFDGIIDSKGEPIFFTGNVSPVSIMDIVNNSDDSFFYIRKDVPADIEKAGRATVKAFGVKSRFVHLEFFRLLSDQHIGKKGDVVALEVNMRPSGGYSPDMMNFANSTDVYKIWADMIAFDNSQKPCGDRYNAGFVGRRFNRNYAMSKDDVVNKYGSHIKLTENVDPALSGAMGDFAFIANFDSESELWDFVKDITR